MKSTRIRKGLSLVLAGTIAFSSFLFSCSEGDKPLETAESGTLETQKRVDINSYPESVVGHGFCGDDAMWMLDKDGTLTIFGSGEMDDYESERPWSEVYSVTGFNKEFEYEEREYYYPKKVVVEEGITSLGRRAFAELDIESVELPDSLETIKSGVFANCEILPQIIIPKNVDDIYPGAFNFCNSLEMFTVDPENQYYLSDENGVLFNKDKTKLVACPATMEGAYAIPEGVVYLEDECFLGCKQMTDISIPLTVSYIGYSSFYACEGLKEVVIPDSISYVYKHAFSLCKNLESVVVGKNVETIHNRTFWGCENLKSITLFEGIKTIENKAFLGCNNIENVYYSGTKDMWNEIDYDVDWDETDYLEDAEIHYEYDITNNIPFEGDLPVNEYEYYVEKTDGNYTYLIIDSGLTGIEKRGVAILSVDNYEGTSITIPETIAGIEVTHIDENAFKDTAIKSITIPDTVICPGVIFLSDPSSGYGHGLSFDGDQIEEVIMDNKYMCSVAGALVRKEDMSFTYYPNAIEGNIYTVPTGVRHISTAAFDKVESLVEVHVPEGVTSISHNAFNHCKNLNTVYLPKSLKYIARYAFDGCNVKDIYYAGSYADWELVDTERTERDYVHFAEPCVCLKGEYVYFEVIPQMNGDIMMAPAMDLFMALGYTYEYNEETREGAAVKENDTLKFTVDSNMFTLNGNTVTAPVNASMYEETVMIPAEFVCGFLKYDAEWESNNLRLVVDAANVQTIMRAEILYQTIESEGYSGIDDFISERTGRSDEFYEIIDDFRDLEIITDGVYDIGLLAIDSILMVSNLSNALSALPEDTVVEFSLNGLEEIVYGIPGNVKATAPEYMTTLALESHRVYPDYLSDLKIVHEKRKNAGYFDYDTALAYVALYEIGELHLQTMSSASDFLAEVYPEGPVESLVYSWKKFVIAALPEVYENTLNDIFFEYDDSKALKRFEEKRQETMDKLSSL